MGKKVSSDGSGEGLVSTRAFVILASSTTLGILTFIGILASNLENGTSMLSACLVGIPASTTVLLGTAATLHTLVRSR